MQPTYCRLPHPSSAYSPLRLQCYSAPCSVYPDHDLSQRRALVFEERKGGDEDADEIRRNHSTKGTPLTFCGRSEGVTVHGSHGSQVAGLEEVSVSDPTEAKNKLRIKIQHRMAVVKLQDVTSDDELCRISQISSRRTSERAHQVA
ncbi:hypothetical protein ACHAWT_005031, partial [Skeletonema menzelii]